MLYVSCASVMESWTVMLAEWVCARCWDKLPGVLLCCSCDSPRARCPKGRTACVMLGRGTCVLWRNRLEVATVFLFGSEMLFLVLHIIVEGTLKSKAPWLRETHGEEGKQTS